MRWVGMGKVNTTRSSFKQRKRGMHNILPGLDTRRSQIAKSPSTLVTAAAATATAAAGDSSTATALLLLSSDILLTRVGMEFDREFAFDAESEIVMRSDRL